MCRRSFYATQEGKQRPQVAELFREVPAGEFLARVEAVQGGKEFHAKLDGFLDQCGHRNKSFSEFAFPTWHEEPVFPIFIIRNYREEFQPLVA